MPAEDNGKTDIELAKGDKATCFVRVRFESEDQ